MKNGWCLNMFGDLVHYVNNKFHNEKCPAKIWDKGSKFWMQNDQEHRLDGPALEYSNGYRYWYYQDKLIHYQCQQKFERTIKLKLLW